MPERVAKRLVRMGPEGKTLLLVVADFGLLLFAAWAAYSLRLGELFVPSARQMFLVGVAPVLTIVALSVSGLYRSVIRYVGETMIWAIVRGMSYAVFVWTALAYMTEMTGMGGMPRSVPILFWLIGIVLLGSARFAARWLVSLPTRGRDGARNVLIYGAGDAGRQLAASLRQGRSEFVPVGFLDDEPTLHGKDVAGLRVYDPRQLGRLLLRLSVRDVFVTLPSVSHVRRKELVAFLESFRVHVRILPALSDIASGRHLVHMLREVDIGDLLGRGSVAPDLALMSRSIAGKGVLITGAGGSIGSELCRQIAALDPRVIVLLETSEHALYQIERALNSTSPREIVPCLGSAEDKELVVRLIEKYTIRTIYHAAAYKHVPMVEKNVLAGARNNVFGTLSVARAALEQGVETFVLISTDKAVRPTNIMGATKRWAELIVHDCARTARLNGSAQRFCAVRFGNVLGSSGSVIPLFREQIAQGGPVTVTHPEITRYFMSIHEAVELVIQAGSLSEGGEVFLLDMGDPVKIVDLASNMIGLAGRTVKNVDNPNGDIEIEFIGLRPGEKLYEELLIAEGNGQCSAHPRILKAAEPGLSNFELEGLLKQLDRWIRADDVPAVRNVLMQMAHGTVQGERANFRPAGRFAVFEKEDLGISMSVV